MKARKSTKSFSTSALAQQFHISHGRVLSALSREEIKPRRITRLGNYTRIEWGSDARSALEQMFAPPKEAPVTETPQQAALSPTFPADPHGFPDITFLPISEKPPSMFDVTAKDRELIAKLQAIETQLGEIRAVLDQMVGFAV